MSKSPVRKHRLRLNRKKIFQEGDLILWLDSKPNGKDQPLSAILELRRIRTGTRTKSDLVWMGEVSTDADHATAMTLKLTRTGLRPVR